MGIKGLLPLLKSIQKPCTLKKFTGQTIGVDAYGWLHRGVLGCAFALALGKPTTIHIDFVLSRVRMLLDFGVTPYLIFDGDNLPSKAGTNAARRKRREESKTLGLELHRAGKTSQAQQELQKSVDVTPLMARHLIEELKKLNVQYIVAPYEADAQLVYLEQKGIIDGILSEDSDLLVFGAKRLLTKLNQYGELVEIERADFPLCKDISLAGWTDTMFMRLAILSGCDYLPNIEKLGLKTAYGYVRKYKDVEKILRMIQFEGKLVVPNGYLDGFQQAELTFLHHRVFCPVTQKMVFLNELSPGVSDSDMPYLGPYVDPDTAIGVACGDLDPFSKKPLRLDYTKSIGRPALGENRRQSYASPAELKPKKSIETFFKPQRQPLAELDPNSLTPSPTQQRLLERHRNASWEPRLINSAPALRRSVTASVSTAAGTDRSAFLARASTMSTYQPPKRQRLCSDSMDPSPSREVKESPFFAATSGEIEASPLAEKKGKVKKSRRSRFEVFSDSSAGEVLLDCDIQQKVSPDKEVALQQPASDGNKEPDDAPESIPQSSPVAASPSPFYPSLPNGSSRSKSNSKSGTPPDPGAEREIGQDVDPDAFEDLLEYHVRKQNEKLLERFAFQSSEKSSSSSRSPSNPQQRRSRMSAQPQELQTGLANAFVKTGPASRCQRTPDLLQTFQYQSPQRRQSALESLGAPAVSRDMLSKAASNPAGLRGSEDAMVPNSEDDGSEIGSPGRKAQLDLSAFAFVRT
ncbi:Rad2 nuclease [Exophiala xenobiotica]|nr:Rad2 nuclease [Exophiala xenobiotica]KAK5362466.1 Rad2 nuclease [Exophiala xenobiotica]KAK5400635.1 Rad2 nuclease [Exophiala xenobiotica]KAK5420940.1 Rad2 nuclease [Exophiala xenobiotica]KAK5469841.1 Rad2 nuclease [Exophiala xenobiotica]